MRKTFLLCALFLFALPARASLASVYVGQAAAGGDTGANCANEHAITFFTTAGNWGAGGAQIGQDTNVHLCGTITSVLTALGSGATGHPITITWETGASMTACDITGSFRLTGRSFIAMDLGGNSTAITCPNNGIGLATAINAIGISDGGSGFSNIEIHNGTVGPFFVYSGGTNSGFSSACISTAAGASSHIHHLYLKGCANTIVYTLSTSGSTNDEFDHLTGDSSCGRFIDYTDGTDGTYTSSNPSIHDNDVDYTSVWAVAGGFQHYEIVHTYIRGSSGSDDHILNLQIYNNYFHGATPGNSGSTGGIFVGTGVASLGTGSLTVKIFNNLFKNTAGGIGWSSGSGGFIYEQDALHTIEVYNNTIDGADTTTDSCVESIVSTSTNNTLTVRNNICENIQFAYYNPQSTGPTLTSNLNDFYTIRNSGNGGYEYRNTVYNTLAGYQGASSQDAGSIITIPGLNADYTITSTGSAAYQFGANLTSLGITALDTGAPQTFGVTGACGTGCVARSASAAWDAGAFPFAAGTPPGPAPAVGFN